MSGFLTSRSIWGCTTFYDHVSDFVHVHMIQHFTVEETLLAVKDFDKTLAQADRLVTHYHADNGIFATLCFVLCMCLIEERKSQEDPDRQSGSHNAVLVST